MSCPKSPTRRRAFPASVLSTSVSCGVCPTGAPKEEEARGAAFIPSANSRHLFDNGQMGFIGASKMRTNAFSQLPGREHSVRLHDGLLRMDPLRFNRVEPGALCGEQE